METLKHGAGDVLVRMEGLDDDGMRYYLCLGDADSFEREVAEELATFGGLKRQEAEDLVLERMIAHAVVTRLPEKGARGVAVRIQERLAEAEHLAQRLQDAEYMASVAAAQDEFYEALRRRLAADDFDDADQRTQAEELMQIMTRAGYPPVDA